MIALIAVLVSASVLLVATLAGQQLQPASTSVRFPGIEVVPKRQLHGVDDRVLWGPANSSFASSTSFEPCIQHRQKIGRLVGSETSPVGASWVRGGCVEAGNRESSALLEFREVTVHGT
jgi:hypothetical protein